MDSPDGLDMLEIEHPALYNYVPDTVDSISRIPFECRTRDKVEKLIKRDFNAENLVNSKKDINPDDAKMLIQMINTSLDLCDGYFSLDEYDTLEYVRGQAELIANVPFLDVDQETVLDIIRKLMHTRSNIPYEVLDKEI